MARHKPTIRLLVVHQSRTGSPNDSGSPVFWLCKNPNAAAQPKNPRLAVLKLARFGKMLGKSVFATPNHVASVAAY